jgi:Ser/Thr protein kinase RdoA (MazF antagonist)
MDHPVLPLDLPLPPPDLLPLLRHIFGTDVDVERYVVAKRRPDYLVLLIHLRHPTLDVVVKLAGPGATVPCDFDRTAMLKRLVAARTSVPMPEIVAVDVTCRAWPWRYLISVAVPGEEWARIAPRLGPDDLRAAHRQIGDAVGQLHAIEMPAFGEIGADGAVEGGAEWGAALAERARRTTAGPRARDLFRTALAARAPLLAGVHRACLCHDDLHKHNILFRREGGTWRLAAIIDLDKAWAGHGETDLARLELWEGMTSADFWPAYTARTPLAPDYHQRRPLYQLLWCLEYARPTPRHLADTRRVCERLGLPPARDFA